MTQAAHTPGPWFDCPAIFSDGYSASVKAVQTGATVALVTGDNPSDAALIAAAPDLLAALELLTEEARAVADYRDDDELDNAIAQATDAIAKAKGE